jgi:hypothetical protein
LAETTAGVWLAMPREEAFWIGIERPDVRSWRRMTLHFLRTDGTTQAVIAERKGSMALAAGFALADGSYECFTLKTVTEIEAHLGRHRTRIRVVDPQVYTAHTGLPGPAPVDATDGYGGWRLP